MSFIEIVRTTRLNLDALKLTMASTKTRWNAESILAFPFFITFSMSDSLGSTSHKLEALISSYSSECCLAAARDDSQGRPSSII